MRSRLTRLAVMTFGVLALVGSANVRLFAAGTPPAPEIDGASLTAGLGLLTAGVLMIRARRSR
jgi:hypothetical protein